MEEEEEEEWLLESLRLYNDLHVFELQDPTRVIEWTRDKSICVAGYESGRKNEVLQLLLPQTLYAKENQGLCPDRDFKVEHGGFSDRPVCQLKHMPETSLLVTSGPPDSSLQVWRMELDETDVIKPLSTIPTAHGDDRTWAKMAAAFSKSARILHGQRINNIQVTEVESGKTVFMADSTDPDEVATLDFLDEATLLACTAGGQLYFADTRQPRGVPGASEEAHLPGALGGQKWCAGVERGLPDKPLVARLSSGGHVVLTDFRKASRPMKVARCPVATPGLLGAEFLAVSLAPRLGNCLAVSGFDGTVHVYDTQNWDSSGQEAKPVFIHKGHIFSSTAHVGDPPLVTAHAWHPCKPRTVLSAARDGSLHVWDWSEPRTAS
ncbi:WD repeat-containing protein 73 [Elgaria multicarinata webbii]|uniref:WD repeat-containing protein 73 n=1 Tax=Elgaria multicarinata webbii TaxID=159646 RepID=UPI002FCD1FD0